MRGPAGIASPRGKLDSRPGGRDSGGDPAIRGSPLPSERAASAGLAGSTLGPDALSVLQEELHDGYLSELLSYSLDRLNKEPELLKADAERVQRQMEGVAVGHYRAFINASEAAHTIRQEISAVDQHLGAMVSEIPKLTQGCNAFLDEAHTVLERRRSNRTMLACHPQLLDLLEIPQLMETCVRNGSYDEALDLEAFMSKLCTMHAKLPVIQHLGEEVKQVTQSMLKQLLQRLRSNIQLPECLRIIGYLRRMGVFSKHGLRLQFLKCREAWLAEVLAEMDTSSPYEHIKRMTDRHRVQLFDVVTQYRAIFADDSSGLEEEVGGAASDGGLLYSWAMHRVAAYLRVLAEEVPKITDGGSLASVLDHCMYCGESLGRVGLDIRGLLPPLFESCIEAMFRRNVAGAVQSFQAGLDVHRWVPLPPLGSGASSRLGGFGEGSVDDVAPPYSLMEHPPLAIFVNGVLAALNELRHCAPLSLRSRLGREVEGALGAVSSVLVRYHQTRVVRESETLLFLALCRAFVEVVCPYVALCFNRCYGSPSAGAVDTRAAADPIRQLVAASLPPPPPPPAEEPKTEEEEAAAEEPANGVKPEPEEAGPAALSSPQPSPK